MSKQTTLILLVVFSIGWLSWTFMLLMGGAMGDCFGQAYSKCWAGKEFGTELAFWRGLAIELLAIMIYLFISRRQDT